MTTTTTGTSRPVAAIVPAIQTFEGEGFPVNRAFPRPGLDQVDPFLLLDEMPARDIEPGAAKGAPDHPHRGFETVTYVLNGEFEHADSAGNRGVIRPGGVQWMTAGAGVVHSEMPSGRLQREGGRLHGFQLWVNLPADKKMFRPRYQAVDASDIPVVQRDGATVRVISGALDGTSGAASTHIPVTYVRATIEPGASLDVPVPASHNAAVYVFDGSGRFGPEARGAEAPSLVLFVPTEGALHLEAGDDGLDALVLTGEPLREPVARYGPFVMNTRDELVEAIEDFQAGRMGEIVPEGHA
jgi:redox-sensitive bicupin YhaK (pirin superfamily)